MLKYCLYRYKTQSIGDGVVDVLNGGAGDVVSKRKIEIHFSLLMSISTNLISYEKQKV